MKLKKLFLHLVVAVGALGVASAAFAHATSGGGTIASAPSVASGKHEFGNTGDGCYLGCPSDGYPADYWKLPLIAGDRVTVDWESSTNSYGNHYANYLYVWPVGTTDYSINNANPLVTFNIGENGKEESKFTANKTGAFPLMFFSDSTGTGGPYDFTAHVHHELVLDVSAATRALIEHAHRKPIRHTGTVALAVYRADGAPVSAGVSATLYAYSGARSYVVGQGAAKGGTIAVRYQIPAEVHGLIRLSLHVRGNGYQARRISWRGIKA
jgi:hypothetical protein